MTEQEIRKLAESLGYKLIKTAPEKFKLVGQKTQHVIFQAATLARIRGYLTMGEGAGVTE